MRKIILLAFICFITEIALSQSYTLTAEMVSLSTAQNSSLSRLEEVKKFNLENPSSDVGKKMVFSLNIGDQNPNNPLFLFATFICGSTVIEGYLRFQQTGGFFWISKEQDMYIITEDYLPLHVSKCIACIDKTANSYSIMRIVNGSIPPCADFLYKFDFYRQNMPNTNNTYNSTPGNSQGNTTCGYCDGTGRIHDDGATYGNTSQKWCEGCHAWVAAGHCHRCKICPMCGGKGYR